MEEGDIAIVHFVGRLAEGEDAGKVFDTTDVDVALETGIYHGNRDYKPLEFQVGEGTVIPGLDDVVREMEVGDEQTIRVEPESAFGQRREDRVVTVSRRELEERSETEATEGELVRAETGGTGWITDVTEDTVEIDFNHELAGEPLEFEVRLLDVRPKG